MANFDISQKVLLEDEGLWSNDAEDSGGETCWGIARKIDTKWSGWAIVDQYKQKPNFPNNLNNHEIKNLVNTFYKINYWAKIKGDEINNQDIATQIYKSYVNTGSEGIILAQRALSIRESGIMDDATLSALNNEKTQNNA